MKLTHLEIREYKSIKELKFSIQSNRICFVGKNECGKSSVLQAISLLNWTDREMEYGHLNKSSDKYPKKGYPVIFGTFEVSTETSKRLLTLAKKHCPDFTIPAHEEKLQLQFKRWGNGLNISISVTDHKSFKLDLSNNVENKAEFYSEFFEEVYPKIEYFEDEELLLEPATPEQLLGNESRFETFRRLLHLGGCDDITNLQEEEYDHVATLLKSISDKFNKIFQKHYRQDSSISISLQTIKNNALAVVINDSTGGSFSVKERSPGFRYYFSFLVNKLYSKAVSGNRKVIFLLDEPGSNLHPNGAKDLLRTFHEVSTKDQLFYTTHNPFLTIRNDLDSLMFVEKDSSQGTIIKNKPYHKKYQVLRKELGILLNDSYLLGDINLIVEGSTEKFAFHRLFQMPEFSELEWVNIYDAEGVSNVSQALNYLGPNCLNLSGIVFFDSDHQAKEERKKGIFKKAVDQSWNWEFLEVNNAFGDKVDRTFEDLFPTELYVTAFNKYCHGLKDLEVFDLPYKDFTDIVHLSAPIIESLDHHFKTFIKPERHKTTSITKHDVVRIVFELISEMNENEANAALSKCKRICEKLLSIARKIEKNVSH
jgi:energy-coupling factor transporter ATP-binding protein EcfA2